MILVDTSVWIDHLRRGDAALASLLDANRVVTHDFVIGEIACGHLRNRAEVLELLQALPRVARAEDDELLYYIERAGLMGRGIGYVDCALLAASALNGVTLWTRDKRLREVADALALSVAMPE